MLMTHVFLHIISISAENILNKYFTLLFLYHLLVDFQNLRIYFVINVDLHIDLRCEKVLSVIIFFKTAIP